MSKVTSFFYKKHEQSINKLKDARRQKESGSAVRLEKEKTRVHKYVIHLNQKPENQIQQISTPTKGGRTSETTPSTTRKIELKIYNNKTIIKNR